MIYIQKIQLLGKPLILRIYFKNIVKFANYRTYFKTTTYFILSQFQRNKSHNKKIIIK